MVVPDFDSQWPDRFVRRALVDPEQLLANPQNWRVHPLEQEEALEGSLDHVGWVGDVIAQDGTDVIVDGHERVELAIARNERVPVAWYDLTDDEVAYVLATRDAITGLAVVDKSKLASLVDEIKAPNSAVSQMLAHLVSGTGIAIPLRDLDGGMSAGAGAGLSLPSATPQSEPETASERFVEIHLTQAALDSISGTLDEWSRMRGFQAINIS